MGPRRNVRARGHCGSQAAVLLAVVLLPRLGAGAVRPYILKGQFRSESALGWSMAIINPLAISQGTSAFSVVQGGR